MSRNEQVAIHKKVGLKMSYAVYGVAKDIVAEFERNKLGVRKVHESEEVVIVQRMFAIALYEGIDCIATIDAGVAAVLYSARTLQYLQFPSCPAEEGG